MADDGDAPLRPTRRTAVRIAGFAGAGLLTSSLTSSLRARPPVDLVGQPGVSAPPRRESGRGYQTPPGGWRRLSDQGAVELTSPLQHLSFYPLRRSSRPGARVVELAITSIHRPLVLTAYRMGGYPPGPRSQGGEYTQLAWRSQPFTAPHQPGPARSGGHPNRCGWQVSALVDTSGWEPGFYYLVLSSAQQPGLRFIDVLVVESDSLADSVVLVHNDLTLLAYNSFGGFSLYRGPDRTFASRARVVGTERPSTMVRSIRQFTEPLVGAAERADRWGAPIGYTCESTLATTPRLLSGARGVAFMGHSEYWSDAMRTELRRARDEEGVHTAFLGANNLYWRIRDRRRGDGELDGIECWKDADDPLSPPTVRWRDPELAAPEQIDLGVMYTGIRPSGGFVVSDAHFPLYAGTGARSGDVYEGLISGEIDCTHPQIATPPQLQLGSHSPVTVEHGRRETFCDQVLWRAQSGAWTFSAGSMHWVWAMQGRDGMTSDWVADFATRVGENAIRLLAGTL